jgi:hypothetical protein
MVATPSGVPAGQGRSARNWPSWINATGPASPELNASSAKGSALRTSTGPCTRPCSTASTPRVSEWAATDTASSRFCGPSDCSEVAGRIAAVSTTGFAGASTRCRK